MTFNKKKDQFYYNTLYFLLRFRLCTVCVQEVWEVCERIL